MSRTEQSKNDCIFCAEWKNFAQNPLKTAGLKSRIICDSKYWRCIPTLGCFEIGYILLVSKKHYPCISAVSFQERENLFMLERRISNLFMEKYNAPFICFEHGTLSGEHTGANSVDHAHLHMIPTKERIWKSILDYICIKNFIQFQDQRTLYQYVCENQIVSYLMFQDSDRKIYLIPDGTKFHSQFFRRVIAEKLDSVVEWDWKQEPYLEKMITTYYKLKEN